LNIDGPNNSEVEKESVEDEDEDADFSGESEG